MRGLTAPLLEVNMAATNEDIANSALLKLGAESITSLSDTTRRARLVNEQFNKIRKRLLRSHPWNFAMKRQYLQVLRDNSTTVNDGTDTFTSGSTLNGETGDRVSIILNSGTLPSPLQQGQIYYMIKLTTTTFQLAENQSDAQSGTPIDIADSPVFDANFELGAPFEYDKKFSLPSDLLRAVREEYKNIDFKVEGQILLTNESEFNLLYIADIDDPTEFDESFDELFATQLAYEVSYPLVQSNTLKQQLKTELDELRRDTRSFDAQEGYPEILETNEWLVSRQ